MRARRLGFLVGLFLTTLATLTLELLDTRLLSVLTWYHLSFFAVSTALFGMSAGAVRVYLGGERFVGERAPQALVRATTALALAIPLAHAANLYIPIEVVASPWNAAALLATTLALALPFYLSGVAVAIALTRVPGPSGLVYAVDLAGAALGSLLVVPLLEALDISSAVLLCGACAAAAAQGFRSFAGGAGSVAGAGLLLLLLAATAANAVSAKGLRVVYAKGTRIDRESVISEAWTIHGQLITRRPQVGPPWYWGAGRGALRYSVKSVGMTIDGAAATVLTAWDGDLDSLAWVQHDVTSLPYHLRRGGRVAVVGVGGGRDLLTALWARSRSVTGIEVNEALLRQLRVDLRELAKLAGRPDVTLVHDEARAWLTRSRQRFDVLQMSLIDTWAATGAGAFTLSENGLYTVEAWKILLDRLAPKGLLSVSRWYSLADASETSRLVALATAVLLERGVADPRRHLVLVGGGRRVATLLVSNEPFTRAEIERVLAVQIAYNFQLLLAPGLRPADELLGRIAAARSHEELEALLAPLAFDYAPPHDERPYFFNIVRPGRLLRDDGLSEDLGVVAKGNLLATRTLVALWAISLVLVATVILGPLARAGLPRMRRGAFASAVFYFSLIGGGYMLVQVPLMQRFSIYLGHPTYTAAVTLFSMILATGLGSLLSDRVAIERASRARIAIPLGIAALLALGTVSLQPLIEQTIAWNLAARCAVVAAFVGTLALPLGLCFPLGLRLVRLHSDDAMPWMWGVNGACGVLASVSAVAISMWSGIDTSLQLATLAYGLLALPAVALGSTQAGART
jgi:hypothetical protein